MEAAMEWRRRWRRLDGEVILEAALGEAALEEAALEEAALQEAA